MFTGIIETTGTVVDATDDEGGRRLRIAVDAAGSDPTAATVGGDDETAGSVADAAVSYDDLHHGQSIAVSGACLTRKDVPRVGDDG